MPVNIQPFGKGVVQARFVCDRCGSLFLDTVMRRADAEKAAGLPQMCRNCEIKNVRVGDCVVSWYGGVRREAVVSEISGSRACLRLKVSSGASVQVWQPITLLSKVEKQEVAL